MYSELVLVLVLRIFFFSEVSSSPVGLGMSLPRAGTVARINRAKALLLLLYSQSRWISASAKSL